MVGTSGYMGVAERICEAGGAMPRWNLPPKDAFSHR